MEGAMPNLRSHKQAFLGVLGLCLLVGMSLPIVEAQTTTATVSGTVTDATGAAMPGAAIQVKNIDTSLTQSALTDGEGRFRVSSLPIGNYEVQASSPGFTTIVRKGLLTLGSESIVDLTLQVGQTEVSLYVDDIVSRVETNSSAVSYMVDQQQLRGLPLNGRNFTRLVSMAPGVAPGPMGNPVMLSLYGAADNYSVSGSRAEGQAFLLDNTNTQGFWNRGTGSGAVGSTLGVEALAGVQVLTNTYSAQFGGNGAVVNAATKSGTNTYHGSVYEFLRNCVFDARNFFDATEPPPFRRNQFGVSLGGPIKKDKLFFFFNYEGLRQFQSQTAIAFVPDANVRQGIVPGVPAQIDIHPRIKSILDLYPLPNGRSLGGGIAESRNIAGSNAVENYFLGRVDWSLSSRDSLLMRYLSDRADFVQPFGGSLEIPFWPENDKTANQYFTIEESRVVSRSVINLLRFSFVRPVESGRSLARHDPLQFLPGLERDDARLDVGTNLLSRIGSKFNVPFILVQNKFTYADDVTWTHRAHNLRFGAAVERIQTSANLANYSGGAYRFNNLEQFLRGTPAFFQGVAAGNADATRDFREVGITPYVHHEWRMTPRLSVNIGLRYDFATNPVGVRHPLYALVDPPNGTAFQKVTNAFKSSPNRKNWDPRFGFAWDPFQNHKTSLRGGFGIFHNRVASRAYARGYAAAPPYFLNSFFAPPFPNPFPTAPQPPPINTTIGAFYNLDNAPYQMQWNLNLQREVFANSVLTIGYVASRGVHLFLSRDLNPPIAIIGPDGLERFGTLTATGVNANPRINPAFARVTLVVAEGNSAYDSLQISLNRPMTRNVAAMMSYTWSKCIDNASSSHILEEGIAGLSNPYNARADRGLCTFDYPNTFRGNTVVSFPFRGNRVVEGWQASAIVMANSGSPFSVTDGFDQAGLQTGLNSRPDAVAGCKAILGTVDHWFNPECFRLQPYGRPGNLGRNTLRGPGMFITDFALLKDTSLGESASVQFRAEFFNIFNHPNFGLPIPDLFVSSGTGATVNPAAGRITTAVPGRQVQFAVKLLF
jgi:outer membrane receptor protein involved in Fe transport